MNALVFEFANIYVYFQINKYLFDGEEERLLHI